jgi:hypothetical protein
MVISRYVIKEQAFTFLYIRRGLSNLVAGFFVAAKPVEKKYA